MNDDSMMIPKRKAPEAIEERGTGSTRYVRPSSRAMGKRKVIEVLSLVLIALILAIYFFYEGRWVVGTSIWYGFWAFTIFIGLWLIVGVVRVLRKGP